MKSLNLSVLFAFLLIGASVSTAPIIPNAILTPGDTSPVFGGTDDLKVICSTSTKNRRAVPESEKNKVFQEYNIDPKTNHPRLWEVDHFIPLELGGSNNIKNLWPQAGWTTPWNFHLKDKLENKLHILVCAGKLSLSSARLTITTDWTKGYTQYVGN